MVLLFNFNLLSFSTIRVGAEYKSQNKSTKIIEAKLGESNKVQLGLVNQVR